METIKEVLMRRDGLTEEEAGDLINEAMVELYAHLEANDLEGAEMVCYDYFGLEPDYLLELLTMMGA